MLPDTQVHTSLITTTERLRTASRGLPKEDEHSAWPSPTRLKPESARRSARPEVESKELAPQSEARSGASAALVAEVEPLKRGRRRQAKAGPAPRLLEIEKRYVLDDARLRASIATAKTPTEAQLGGRFFGPEELLRRNLPRHVLLKAKNPLRHTPQTARQRLRRREEGRKLLALESKKDSALIKPTPLGRPPSHQGFGTVEPAAPHTSAPAVQQSTEESQPEVGMKTGRTMRGDAGAVIPFSHQRRLREHQLRLGDLADFVLDRGGGHEEGLRGVSSRGSFTQQGSSSASRALKGASSRRRWAPKMGMGPSPAFGSTYSSVFFLPPPLPLAPVPQDVEPPFVAFPHVLLHRWYQQRDINPNPVLGVQLIPQYRPDGTEKMPLFRTESRLISRSAPLKHLILSAVPMSTSVQLLKEQAHQGAPLQGLHSWDDTLLAESSGSIPHAEGELQTRDMRWTMEAVLKAWRAEELASATCEDRGACIVPDGCGETWGPKSTFEQYSGAADIDVSRIIRAKSGVTRVLLPQSGVPIGWNAISADLRGWAVSRASFTRLVDQGSHLVRLVLGPWQARCLGKRELFQAFSLLHSLKHVALPACTAFDDEVAAFVAASPCAPHLLSLDLSHSTSFSNDGLGLLCSGCRQLEALSLVGCTQLLDSGMLAISSDLRLLHALDVSWCEGISHLGLVSVLARCPVQHLAARGLGRGFVSPQRAMDLAAHRAKPGAEGTPGAGERDPQFDPRGVPSDWRAVVPDSVHVNITEPASASILADQGGAGLATASASSLGDSAVLPACEVPASSWQHLSKVQVDVGQGMGGGEWLRQDLMGALVEVQVTSLKQVDLTAAVGVEDATVISLVRNAPNLTHFRAGHCTRLTAASTTALALFSEHLLELHLPYCTGVASPLVDRDIAFLLATRAGLLKHASQPPSDEADEGLCRGLTDQVRASERARARYSVRHASERVRDTDAFDKLAALPADHEQILQPRWQSLRSLDLGGCAGVLQEDVQQLLEGCPDISTLRLSAVHDIGADLFEKLKVGTFRLTSISLRCIPSIDSVAVQTLAEACPDLRKLDLTACTAVTDAGVAALAVHCPLLHEIRLGKCSASLSCGAVLALAKGCRQLRVLEAGHASGPAGRGSSRGAPLRGLDETELLMDYTFDGDMLLFLVSLAICCPYLVELDLAHRMLPRSSAGPGGGAGLAASMSTARSLLPRDSLPDVASAGNLGAGATAQSSRGMRWSRVLSGAEPIGDIVDPSGKEQHLRDPGAGPSLRFRARTSLGPEAGVGRDSQGSTSPLDLSVSSSSRGPVSSELLFPQLSRLNLRNSGYLSDSALTLVLGAAPNLLHLDVTGCEGVTAACVSHVAAQRRCVSFVMNIPSSASGELRQGPLPSLRQMGSRVASSVTVADERQPPPPVSEGASLPLPRKPTPYSFTAVPGFPGERSGSAGNIALAQSTVSMEGARFQPTGREADPGGRVFQQPFLGFCPVQGASFALETEAVTRRLGLEHTSANRIRMLVLHGIRKQKQLLFTLTWRLRVKRLAQIQYSARRVTRFIRTVAAWKCAQRLAASTHLCMWWRRMRLILACQRRVMAAIEARRVAQTKRLAASMLISTVDSILTRLAFNWLRMRALVGRWEDERRENQVRGLVPRYDQDGRPRVQFALPAAGPEVLGATAAKAASLFAKHRVGSAEVLSASQQRAAEEAASDAAEAASDARWLNDEGSAPRPGLDLATSAAVAERLLARQQRAEERELVQAATAQLEQRDLARAAAGSQVDLQASSPSRSAVLGAIVPSARLEKATSEARFHRLAVASRRLRKSDASLLIQGADGMFRMARDSDAGRTDIVRPKRRAVPQATSPSAQRQGLVDRANSSGMHATHHATESPPETGQQDASEPDFGPAAHALPSAEQVGREPFPVTVTSDGAGELSKLATSIASQPATSEGRQGQPPKHPERGGVQSSRPKSVSWRVEDALQAAPEASTDDSKCATTRVHDGGSKEGIPTLEEHEASQDARASFVRADVYPRQFVPPKGMPLTDVKEVDLRPVRWTQPSTDSRFLARRVFGDACPTDGVVSASTGASAVRAALATQLGIDVQAARERRAELESRESYARHVADSIKACGSVRSRPGSSSLLRDGTRPASAGSKQILPQLKNPYRLPKGLVRTVLSNPMREYWENPRAQLPQSAVHEWLTKAGVITEHGSAQGGGNVFGSQSSILVQLGNANDPVEAMQGIVGPRAFITAAKRRIVDELRAWQDRREQAKLRQLQAQRGTELRIRQGLARRIQLAYRQHLFDVVVRREVSRAQQREADAQAAADYERGLTQGEFAQGGTAWQHRCAALIQSIVRMHSAMVYACRLRRARAAEDVVKAVHVLAGHATTMEHSGHDYSGAADAILELRGACLHEARMSEVLCRVSSFARRSTHLVQQRDERSSAMYVVDEVEHLMTAMREGSEQEVAGLLRQLVATFHPAGCDIGTAIPHNLREASGVLLQGFGLGNRYGGEGQLAGSHVNQADLVHSLHFSAAWKRAKRALGGLSTLQRLELDCAVAVERGTLDIEHLTAIQGDLEAALRVAGWIPFHNLEALQAAALVTAGPAPSTPVGQALRRAFDFTSQSGRRFSKRLAHHTVEQLPVEDGATGTASTRFLPGSAKKLARSCTIQATRADAHAIRQLLLGEGALSSGDAAHYEGTSVGSADWLESEAQADVGRCVAIAYRVSDGDERPEAGSEVKSWEPWQLAGLVVLEEAGPRVSLCEKQRQIASILPGDIDNVERLGILAKREVREGPEDSKLLTSAVLHDRRVQSTAASAQPQQPSLAVAASESGHGPPPPSNPNEELVQQARNLDMTKVLESSSRDSGLTTILEAHCLLSSEQMVLARQARCDREFAHQLSVYAHRALESRQRMRQFIEEVLPMSIEDSKCRCHASARQAHAWLARWKRSYERLKAAAAATPKISDVFARLDYERQQLRVQLMTSRMNSETAHAHFAKDILRSFKEVHSWGRQILAALEQRSENDDKLIRRLQHQIPECEKILTFVRLRLAALRSQWAKQRQSTGASRAAPLRSAKAATAMAKAQEQIEEVEALLLDAEDSEDSDYGALAQSGTEASESEPALRHTERILEVERIDDDWERVQIRQEVEVLVPVEFKWQEDPKWTVHRTKEGQTYYFNTETQTSQWEEPTWPKGEEPPPIKQTAEKITWEKRRIRGGRAELREVSDAKKLREARLRGRMKLSGFLLEGGDVQDLQIASLDPAECRREISWLEREEQLLEACSTRLQIFLASALSQFHHRNKVESKMVSEVEQLQEQLRLAAGEHRRSEVEVAQVRAEVAANEFFKANEAVVKETEALKQLARRPPPVPTRPRIELAVQGARAMQRSGLVKWNSARFAREQAQLVRTGQNRRQGKAIKDVALENRTRYMESVLQTTEVVARSLARSKTMRAVLMPNGEETPPGTVLAAKQPPPHPPRPARVRKPTMVFDGSKEVLGEEEVTVWSLPRPRTFRPAQASLTAAAWLFYACTDDGEDMANPGFWYAGPPLDVVYGVFGVRMQVPPHAACTPLAPATPPMSDVELSPRPAAADGTTLSTRGAAELARAREAAAQAKAIRLAAARKRQGRMSAAAVKSSRGKGRVRRGGHRRMFSDMFGTPAIADTDIQATNAAPGALCAGGTHVGSKVEEQQAQLTDAMLERARRHGRAFLRRLKHAMEAAESMPDDALSKLRERLGARTSPLLLGSGEMRARGIQPPRGTLPQASMMSFGVEDDVAADDFARLFEEELKQDEGLSGEAAQNMEHLGLAGRLMEEAAGVLDEAEHEATARSTPFPWKEHPEEWVACHSAGGLAAWGATFFFHVPSGTSLWSPPTVSQRANLMRKAFKVQESARKAREQAEKAKQEAEARAAQQKREAERQALEEFRWIQGQLSKHVSQLEAACPDAVNALRKMDRHEFKKWLLLLLLPQAARDDILCGRATELAPAAQVLSSDMRAAMRLHSERSGAVHKEALAKVEVQEIVAAVYKVAEAASVEFVQTLSLRAVLRRVKTRADFDRIAEKLADMQADVDAEDTPDWWRMMGLVDQQALQHRGFGGAAYFQSPDGAYKASLQQQLDRAVGRLLQCKSQRASLHAKLISVLGKLLDAMRPAVHVRVPAVVEALRVQSTAATDTVARRRFERQARERRRKHEEQLREKLVVKARNLFGVPEEDPRGEEELIGMLRQRARTAKVAKLGSSAVPDGEVVYDSDEEAFQEWQSLHAPKFASEGFRCVIAPDGSALRFAGDGTEFVQEQWLHRYRQRPWETGARLLDGLGIGQSGSATEHANAPTLKQLREYKLGAAKLQAGGLQARRERVLAKRAALAAEDAAAAKKQQEAWEEKVRRRVEREVAKKKDFAKRHALNRGAQARTDVRHIDALDSFEHSRTDSAPPLALQQTRGRVAFSGPLAALKHMWGKLKGSTTGVSFPAALQRRSKSTLSVDSKTGLSLQRATVRESSKIDLRRREVGGKLRGVASIQIVCGRFANADMARKQARKMAALGTKQSREASSGVFLQLAPNLGDEQVPVHLWYSKTEEMSDMMGHLVLGPYAFDNDLADDLRHSGYKYCTHARALPGVGLWYLAGTGAPITSLTVTIGDATKEVELKARKFQQVTGTWGEGSLVAPNVKLWYKTEMVLQSDAFARDLHKALSTEIFWLRNVLAELNARAEALLAKGDIIPPAFQECLRYVELELARKEGSQAPLEDGAAAVSVRDTMHFNSAAMTALRDSFERIGLNRSGCTDVPTLLRFVSVAPAPLWDMLLHSLDRDFDGRMTFGAFMRTIVTLCMMDAEELSAFLFSIVSMNLAAAVPAFREALTTTGSPKSQHWWQGKLPWEGPGAQGTVTMVPVLAFEQLVKAMHPSSNNVTSHVMSAIDEAHFLSVGDKVSFMHFSALFRRHQALFLPVFDFQQALRDAFPNEAFYKAQVPEFTLDRQAWRASLNRRIDEEFDRRRQWMKQVSGVISTSEKVLAGKPSHSQLPTAPGDALAARTGAG